MSWQPEDLDSRIFSLLEKRADFTIPLTQAAPEQPLPSVLISGDPADLFPGARSPIGGLAGLILLWGDWERCHHLIQDDQSAEASYWHTILHRMEPDTGNANWWARRLGNHSIFGPMRSRAVEILAGAGVSWKLREQWDLTLFCTWCEEARTRPGSSQECAALALQAAEWRLLFDYCALKTKPVR